MKKICLVLAFIFVFVNIMQFAVLASDIMPLNNNVLSTKTRFTISDTGEAIVSLNCEGYPNVTTGATISISIEKRNFLFFWSNIIEETITVEGSDYFEELQYQLEDSGTYKCTVEYVISGTGGADDVITYEEEQAF